MGMKRIINIESWLLVSHVVSIAFGLAGLLLVLSHPSFIANLPELGQIAFRWSMAFGGVIYMILGAAAVAIYGYRSLGVWHCLTFAIPATALSLTSELLGTSTGFPFGHYRYLSGLGLKIADLVPFTIPLSWFYLGFSAYIIARVGLERRQMPKWLSSLGAIVLGALLLTSWDLVLDPAMSQTDFPFWIWEGEGAFFGMPYQNLAGLMGTGILFMTVATLLWKLKPLNLDSTQLRLPLAIYLSNFVFAGVMCLGAGFYLPALLGILLGVVPGSWLYLMANSIPVEGRENNLPLKIPAASAGAHK